MSKIAFEFFPLIYKASEDSNHRTKYSKLPAVTVIQLKMSSISVALLVLTISAMALAGPAVPVSPLLTIQEQFRPYEFGYDFADGLGMSQQRKEVADGTGVVKGAYGYQDPLGVYRRVSIQPVQTGTRL
ncbi:hypothetical protein CEXT_167761 [Caerostris extrusa]|uniref:Uncharacterized protein n=1 Tax=Caerostris extrusa TaxID=172846 RepID=A0AAV4MLX5_CAEEX|nr:hypothetical protein CEXT_167761 [Caerostris extrusa]